MKTLECNGKKIFYCQVNENFDHICGYVICKVMPDDIRNIVALKSGGFRFHDRIIAFAVDIRNTEQSRSKKNKFMSGYSFVIDKHVDMEMKSMAYSVYTTDRRFHLEEEYDQSSAMEIITSYIAAKTSDNYDIVKAYYKGRLTGYIILNYADGNAENVLGVTESSISGKMGAYALYCCAMEVAANQGCRKYIGLVSSKNMASLNLHINLGATIYEIYDEYILRKD